MHARLPEYDIVLVGAGHTNMHVARMWRMQPVPRARLTLVSPFSRATYSGMLPGTLAGTYQPEDMQIDLWRFAASHDLRLVVAPVIGLDAQRRRILFDDRPPLRYDVLSIGIGSVPAAGEVWRQHAEVLSIKPMATFLERFETQLQRCLERAAQRAEAEDGGWKMDDGPFAATLPRPASDRFGHPPSSILHSQSSTATAAPPRAMCGRRGNDTVPTIAVVGAGAGGTEITFCLDTLLRKRGIDARLVLFDAGDAVLNNYAQRTRRLARQEFDRRGVELCTGRTVTGYAAGQLEFADGDSRTADIVVWATAAAPPRMLKDFDLPRAHDGFLAVRKTLQSTGDERVFVVGDTGTLVDHPPLPKAGVYAVREGPVLWENIRRLLRGEKLDEFDPQKDFLSLLSTGDGRAIAQYKGLAFHNRLMWKWKDHIDRKFMRKYQDYRPMTPEMMAARLAQDRDGRAPTMRCKGCGGKVGAGVLRAALERLQIPPSPIVRRGLDQPDDAAVLDPAAAAAEVLSLDFFQAFLDDPYLVGRVAALNSLSDLWAMGSEPVGAMAMVTLPEGEPRAQAEMLYHILAGGLRELEAAGATLLGGHTTEAAELTVGYTVLGKLNGREPTTKAGLNPGDRLILTKPLGTGALLAAHGEAKCRAQWMDVMLAEMLHSNAAAAQAARELNASGVTDVTGFGLAGHLFEMLDASRVSARLSLEALPLYEGFAELAAAGVESTLAPANRELADRLTVENPSLRRDPRYAALFDPQTSGGMLIAVGADEADEALDRFRAAGARCAQLIGEVTSPAVEPRLEIGK